MVVYGLQDETINHYFLYCPRFAALRQILLSSVAQYFNDTWRHMSDSQKVNILLFGSLVGYFRPNVDIYKNVKSFLMILHFVFVMLLMYNYLLIYFAILFDYSTLLNVFCK